MKRALLAIGSPVILATCALATLAADPDLDPASRLEDPEEEAWKTFHAAVTCLQDKGDRESAGKLFQEVVERFPDSPYAQDSKELGAFLERMVKEDAAWEEPENIATLSLPEKIDYNIHHLRNVNCYQWSQPGMCYLLRSYGRDRDTNNAAIALKEIGLPAIPALITLLDDRRPTRSVGYWRNFSPSRTVLRYQDAAIQILNALTPTPFYRRSSTAAYFSTESPEIRAKTTASVQSWYRKSRGKSETEQRWIAIEEEPGIYQVLSLLETVAKEPGQKERVLQKLRQMCRIRDRIQLPQISYLMCQLGDCSRLAEVADAYLAGEYDVGMRLLDDSAAGSNAQDYALRQTILYGNEKHHADLRKHFYLKKDPLSKRQALFDMLFDLASGEHERLPDGYAETRFPIHLLIDALDFRDGWGHATDGSSQWAIRKCDAAAEAIQSLANVDFGYDEKAPIEAKDATIARIRSWWQDQERNGVAEQDARTNTDKLRD